jgi:uncharacterized membrane protein
MLKESNVEYQTRSTEIPWLSWMGGIALGALAMYIADPVQGRRRRALIQDKLTHVTHSTSRLMDQTLHDAHNRWSGLQASAMRMLSPRQAKPIDDHVLEARVRSRLGRAMSHMHDVEVHAHQGAVTLSGNLDSEEQEKVLRLVAAIPGVESVIAPTQAQTAGRPLLIERSPLWIAGAAGAGFLTWYALTRRQPVGLLAAATGLGLISRSGAGARRSSGKLSAQGPLSYEAERTIDIAASPDVVFDVWSRYENFPHFMSQVTEVRDLGQNRSHWIVQGPAGQDVEWDSVLTVSERPHRLAWRSEPNASVDHEGAVLLESAGEGTRATVRLFWRPPAGTSGKALAVLSATDPERVLEDDLDRMKEFIERGLPTRGEAGGISGGNVLH